MCVCVSTFSEPTKLSDEKITEKSKFLCVAFTPLLYIHVTNIPVAKLDNIS